MSEPHAAPKPPKRPPPMYETASPSVLAGPAVVWGLLLLILAVNIAVAHLPLGRAKTPLNLSLAAVQASLMFTVFMRLNRGSALVRLTAVAGLLWLSFLFLIGSADYLTRAAISP